MSFGLIINHNLGSMSALSALNQNQDSLQSMLKQLSTGKQINSAADNAAGYAISQKMQSQIDGLNQASQNSQDGISLLQTASGALNETQSILQRMRQLAVQSSNDTNTSQDRQNLQAEVTQLSQQIDTIANTTQFNTKDLLNGGAGIEATITPGDANNTAAILGGGSGIQSGTDLNFKATAASAANVTITAGSTDDLMTGSGTSNPIVINGVTVSLGANMSGSDIASAINAVSGQSGVTATYSSAATTGTSGKLVLTSSQIGSTSGIKLSGLTESKTTPAVTDTFVGETSAGAADVTNAIKATATSSTGTASTVYDGSAALAAATNSTATGADASVASLVVKDSTGTPVTNPTVTASGNVVTFHGGAADGLQVNVGAKSDGSKAIDVNISSNNTLNLQIGANQGQTMSIGIGSMTSTALGVNNIDITSSTSASDAVSTVDSALQQVSLQQAQLGAYQNRLQDSISTVDTSSQNLTTAEAGITDTNMASAMANFTKDNVLQQAAISMLAQANQQPQLVLKLLG